MFGVFFGFVAAVRYADSPRLFAAVQSVSRAINLVLDYKRPPAPLDNDALIVTADHDTELTSVATLSPRGYRAVIACGAQDALDRVHAPGGLWKLVVIDASLPGAAALTRHLHDALPAVNLVAVVGKNGAQAVSRALLEQLN